MTDNTEDLLASISLSKVLIAILESIGEVKVSTMSFLEADDTKKEILMEYGYHPKGTEIEKEKINRLWNEMVSWVEGRKLLIKLKNLLIK